MMVDRIAFAMKHEHPQITEKLTSGGKRGKETRGA
jgi:hypothetical protein